jgi:glycosyltransferase involved in cell wall biosynthesis
MLDIDPQMQSLRHTRSAKVSCVVPAYNEHDNLAVLLPLLQGELNQLTEQWEIIIVDDGSQDKTSTLMAAWCQQPGFRYVELSRNFGKEAAITAGMNAGTGDVMILLDADLQHPPRLVAPMLARWEQGVDMVYAVRESREDETWLKRMGSQFFYTLLKGSHGVQVPPNAGDFRLMDRSVVEAIMQLPERNRFMKGLYAWVGFKTESIDYMPEDRHSGQTTFGTFRLFKLALAGLMSFTTWPLRAVSLAGFLVSMCAFMYGLYIVVEFILFRNRVDGWPTIVTILLFFSGINLLSLGIVGEYIARIFDEVKGRPLYLVRQSRGQATHAGGLKPQPAPQHESSSVLDPNITSPLSPQSPDPSPSSRNTPRSVTSPLVTDASPDLPSEKL